MTLTELVAPHDHSKGSKTLKIREEADKARYGREVPLSDRAREALDSVCPKKGKLFPAPSTDTRSRGQRWPRGSRTIEPGTSATTTGGTRR